MRCEGNKLAPVLAQDLDTAECPAEALLLQAVEGQGHEAGAVRAAIVGTSVASAEHAQACLRVLGDARLAPPSDLLERRTAEKPHGSAEDDGIAVVARRHGDVEEVAEAVEETAQIAVVLPVAIVLRALREGDARIIEMP